MTEIKIQTIAHGSQIYRGHRADYTREVTVQEVIQAYINIDLFLKENGRIKQPEKIRNKLLEEGVIGPGNAEAVYLHNNCLVENMLVPTVLDGTFHVVKIAGRPPEISQVIALVKNPRIDYSHYRKDPTTYNFAKSLNLARFNSISELEKFLKGR